MKKNILKPAESSNTAEPALENSSHTSGIRRIISSIAHQLKRTVNKEFRALDDAANESQDPFIKAIRDAVYEQNITLKAKAFSPEKIGGSVVILEQDTHGTDVLIVLTATAPAVVRHREPWSLGQFLSAEEHGLAKDSGLLQSQDEENMQSIDITLAVRDTPPFILGEMAHMTPGNKRTATVTSRGTVTALAISQQDYRTLLASAEVDKAAQLCATGRAEATMNMMNAERHQRTEELYSKLRALQEPTGIPAEEALDVEQYAENLPQTTEFQLIGFNKNGEKRACNFTVAYTCPDPRKPDVIGIRITCKQHRPDQTELSTIALTYTLPSRGKGASVYVNSAKMHDNSGFGFTSMIYPILFKNADCVESRVTEENTTKFIGANSRENIYRKKLSHAELAAHSPIVAARRGFISQYDLHGADAMDWYEGVGDIRSYRIDDTLRDILAVATDLERCMENNDSIADTYNGLSEERLLQMLEEALMHYHYPRDGEYAKVIEELVQLQLSRIRVLQVEVEARRRRR